MLGDQNRRKVLKKDEAAMDFGMFVAGRRGKTVEIALLDGGQRLDEAVIG